MMDVMQKINPKDAYLFIFFVKCQFIVAPLYTIENPVLMGGEGLAALLFPMARRPW